MRQGRVKCVNCHERPRREVVHIVTTGILGWRCQTLAVCTMCKRTLLAMFEDMGVVRVSNWDQLPLPVQATVPLPHGAP